MRIDKETGSVTLPGPLTLTVGMSLDLIQDTPPRHLVIHHHERRDWRELEIDEPLSQSGKFDRSYVELSYLDGALYGIKVVALDVRGPRSWDGLTDDDVWRMEDACKAYHDQFVREQLGEPHELGWTGTQRFQQYPALWLGSLSYRFAWGTVVSGLDERTPMSFVAVSYALEGLQT